MTMQMQKMFLPANAIQKLEGITACKDEDITAFVETYFNKGRQFIHTMGKHLPPCYLFEPSVITARAEKFKHAFQNLLPDTGNRINGGAKVMDANPSTPIDHFAHEISQALYQHIHNQLACQICFEPGR